MSTDSSVAVRDANGATQLIDNGERTTGAGTVKTQRVEVIHADLTTGSTVGPSSYATGGFVIDLTATFSSIDFLQVAVTTVGPNLPPCHYEYALNSPSNGKATVKVMRHRYDKLTSIGNVSGAPGGVTVAAASGQATGANQSAGIAPTAGIAGNAADDATHTHTTDILYQHQHSNTQTQTDSASVELAAGVDLSGTTWRYLAVGA